MTAKLLIDPKEQSYGLAVVPAASRRLSTASHLVVATMFSLNGSRYSNEVHISRKQERNHSHMNESPTPESPVPQWQIALPVVGAAVAVIIVVSNKPGPLTLAIFFVSLFLFGYLYFYLIGIWHRHRSKHRMSYHPDGVLAPHGTKVDLGPTADLRRETVLDRNQPGCPLPISRRMIALPSIGAMAAAILLVGGHTGPLILGLFLSRSSPLDAYTCA